MDINVNLTAKISIHALHEESDHLFKGVVTMAENFNPRSP